MNMTYNQLYRHIISRLKKAGIETPAFDCLCLFEKVFAMTRHDIIIDGEISADAEQEKQILVLAEKRATHYPLQYLCGMWQFMDSEFFVGEGVLIPREDTATVVELCADEIRKQKIGKPKILDLCAGSGAISISLARLFPKSEVIALELSPQAFSYLEKNIVHNRTHNVSAVYGDVLKNIPTYPANTFDVMISNPPYIVTDEIGTLQKEVQYEPFMALDGGKDGYLFYRKIISEWKSSLKNNGILVFESGENQYDTIAELMRENGFQNIRTAYDIQNIKRGICGQFKGCCP